MNFYEFATESPILAFLLCWCAANVLIAWSPFRNTKRDHNKESRDLMSDQ